MSRRAAGRLNVDAASRWVERQVNVGLKAGQYVAWSASKGQSKGRVVSVHTGKVPGVIGAHTATADGPAARVQLYAKSGTGWEPTSVHIAQSVGSLTTIDALPEPAAATEAIVAGSFDDIRATVQDAIKDRIEALAGTSPSIYVCDIGFTWAVYMVDYGDDLWMIEYSLDAAGVVTLSDPVEVSKVTSYVPEVAPVDADTGEVITESATIEGRLLAAMPGTDSAGGRVFHMQLIAYGDSKNGRRYTEAVMRAAAPLYNGAKAFDHHRPLAELNTSTVNGLVGTYRNVEATSVGLEADLHVLPGATHIAEALDLSLANQAQGLPPLVGVSHDVLAQWRRISVDGRQLTEATAIHQVNSVDVVADPSAGGKTMRMVAGGPGDPDSPTNKKQEIQVTYKQLLALFRATEAAKRPALLTEHGQLIESFGFSTDEFSREIESTIPTPAPPAPAARATEAATYDKTSPLSRMLVREAVTSAKLADGFLENVVAELTDHFTEAELTATVARYVRATEAAGLSPSVPHVEVTKDQHDKDIENLDLMLNPRVPGGFGSFKEAYVRITGRQPRSWIDDSFNREIMRECVSVALGGGERVPFDSNLRGTESVSTSTFGFILGDSITRRMIAEYAQPDLQVWRQFVSSYRNVNDFRSQKVEAMGGYGTLPAVNQGATYNALTTPGNEEGSYTITKRGGTEDLTIEAIANDDIGAFQRIPVKLGLAAAQTIFRFVLDIFNTNPTLSRDATALFAAGHANTATTALSSTGLEAIRLKMRKQAAYGDSADILSLVPKFLIVPPELEVLAWQLCTSAVAIPSGAPVGAASNTPNIHQGMSPVVVDYFSATSTTAWFLLADPSLAPTIEMGFLNGQQDPALFVQNDPTTGSVFSADKVTWKIRHIYSGIPIDYRAFQRGNT